MSNPDSKEQNIMLADINPSLLLSGEVPRLIDEWQLAPKIWDAIRFEIKSDAILLTSGDGLRKKLLIF